MGEGNLFAFIAEASIPPRVVADLSSIYIHVMLHLPMINYVQIVPLPNGQVQIPPDSQITQLAHNT